MNFDIGRNSGNNSSKSKQKNKTYWNNNSNQ